MKIKIKRFFKVFFGIIGIIGGCFLFCLFVIGIYFLLFLEIIKLFKRKKVENNNEVIVRRLYS